MWEAKFTCPDCSKPLRKHGIYSNVRRVLDVSCFYYIATEHLDCICGKSFQSWDSRLMSQLPYGTQLKFPAVLTYKYAVDKNLLIDLRARTLGNSPTSIHTLVNLKHSESYIKRSVMYLEDVKRHRAALKMHCCPAVTYSEVLPMTPVPTPKWFLSTYARDVMFRKDTLKGSITSVFGEILKIDSTKKILKKLQGFNKQSASWVTNVGNEYGGILNCVVTCSESNESLKKMAFGLMERYAAANVSPPKVIYTDRDCCNKDGTSKINTLFNKWEYVKVRLDIWHWMRRIAIGCRTESHHLYGTFMTQLSKCIFEVDSTDHNLLRSARRALLKAAGVANPTKEAVINAITSNELQQHCRRKTRQPEVIRTKIDKLITTFTGATDVLGVTLFNEQMATIWNEQQRHVACVVDLPDLQLYTQTGTLMKGGIKLPVYRCARGSNSLESFHSHIHRFIPGTAANDVNFQVYLLDGLARWNIARKEEFQKTSRFTPKTFDLELAARADQLSLDVHDKLLLSKEAPSARTEELIGMEYLFNQNKMELNDDYVEKYIDDVDDLEQRVEEQLTAFARRRRTNSSSSSSSAESLDFDSMDVPDIHSNPPEDNSDNYDITSDEDPADEDPVDDGPADNVTAGDDPPDDDPPDDDPADNDDDETANDCTDTRGIPGWSKVDLLARALIDQSECSITNKEATRILKLYENLDEFDRRPMVFEPVAMKPASGRYQRSKSGHVGVDAVKRCLTSAGSPSLPPSKSRLVEAIFTILCNKNLGSTTIRSPNKRQYQSRWKTILIAYQGIRSSVNNCQLLQKTTITLFNVNETSLMLWYKDKTRTEETNLLLRGKDLPATVDFAKTNEPREMSLPKHDFQHKEFPQNKDIIGTSKKRPLTIRPQKQQQQKQQQQQQQQLQHQQQQWPVGNNVMPQPLFYQQQQYLQQQQQQMMQMFSQQQQQLLRQLQQQQMMFGLPMMHPIKPKEQSPAVFVPTPPPASLAILPFGVTAPSTTTTSTTKALPKTTYYRHLKKGSKERKEYSCRKCNQPMKAPHSQFYGRRYCPYEKDALPYEEWKKVQREDMLKNKK